MVDRRPLVFMNVNKDFTTDREEAMPRRVKKRNVPRASASLRRVGTRTGRRDLGQVAIYRHMSSWPPRPRQPDTCERNVVYKAASPREHVGETSKFGVRLRWLPVSTATRDA